MKRLIFLLILTLPMALFAQTRQVINVGTSANDGTGDPLRTAMQKTNTNFSWLFSLPYVTMMNTKYIPVGLTSSTMGYYSDLYREPTDTSLRVKNLTAMKRVNASHVVSSLISFPSLGGVSGTYMRGFRNDSTTSTNEDKVTLSAQAIRQLVKANAGGSGTFSGDTITFSDNSRIFGGGGQIDIQPTEGAGNGARFSVYTAGGGDTLVLESNNKPAILNFPITHVPNIVSFQDSVYVEKYLGETYSPGQVFTLTSTGALKATNPIKTVQVLLTDTISPAGNTKYILGIGDDLTGCNLIRVEAICGENAGTAVPTVNVYRKRSTTETTMTSTGANLTTNATINTSYDDVIQGDRLKVAWTLGSGTAPYGIIAILSFQKP